MDEVATPYVVLVVGGVYPRASTIFSDVISLLIVSDDLFSTFPSPICVFVTVCGLFLLEM